MICHIEQLGKAKGIIILMILSKGRKTRHTGTLLLDPPFEYESSISEFVYRAVPFSSWMSGVSFQQHSEVGSTA
jgi:hypothetical protein